MESTTQTEQAFSFIHTSCNGCIFATGEGKTQEGCQLGHIDAHRQQGGRVAECVDQDGNEFFVLDGHACLDKRPLSWGKDLDLPQQKDKLRGEHKIRLKAFVRCTPHTQLHEITTTVNSLIRQTEKVYQVVILMDPHPTGFSRSDLFDYLRPIDSVSWQVHAPVLQDQYPGVEIDFYLRACKSTFYSLFWAGYRVPEEFVAQLNHALFNEKIKFLRLRPTASGNAETVMTLVHNKLGGNRPAQTSSEYGEEINTSSIGEKLDFVIQQEGFTTFQRDVSEVLPCLQPHG